VDKCSGILPTSYWCERSRIGSTASTGPSHVHSSLPQLLHKIQC
jgi:hypothetical protein